MAEKTTDCGATRSYKTHRPHIAGTELSSGLGGVDTARTERSSGLGGVGTARTDRSSDIGGLDTAKTDRCSDIGGVDTAKAHRSSDIGAVGVHEKLRISRLYPPRWLEHASGYGRIVFVAT